MTRAGAIVVAVVYAGVGDVRVRTSGHVKTGNGIGTFGGVSGIADGNAVIGQGNAENLNTIALVFESRQLSSANTATLESIGAKGTDLRQHAQARCSG